MPNARSMRMPKSRPKANANVKAKANAKPKANANAKANANTNAEANAKANANANANTAIPTTQIPPCQHNQDKPKNQTVSKCGKCAKNCPVFREYVPKSGL